MASKLVFEKEEILWKDRRRYFGLPISFTRYEVTGDRLTTRRGFFNTVTDEVLIYRIMDVQLAQRLGQKIFGVGTVTLISADKSHPTLEIKSVKNADDVRRFLSKLIEEQRGKRGISSREFFGDSVDDDMENGSNL